MPDILIRMEMPKTCLDCPFFVLFRAKKTGICTAFGDGTNREKMSERMKESGRMSGCPLVELPEHGSLIDRDAIPYKKIMFDDDDFYYGVTQPYIDRMPVIVPASEEVADGNEP